MLNVNGANFADRQINSLGVIMNKTMMRLTLLVALCVAASLCFIGCASAPTAEINATKAAIAAAQTEDIQTYASESLKTAEDTLAQATSEVQTQEGKSGFSRDYKAASELLKQAKDAAAKAQAEAQANKAKTKADAEALIAGLATQLADAKKALATAPKGKDTKAELEALQNDLKSADEAAVAASTAMSQEKFMDALGQARAAKEKADGVIEQVTAAKAKIKGHK
jgi:lipopolysaccharide export LptBFGC system permease protein LptF